MIKLHSDKDLQPLNTMAIPSTARYFYKLTQPDELNELSELSRAKSVPIRTLGDGSN
jgi:UDP-N-acetylenolpyruvoylglucosamine reductase